MKLMDVWAIFDSKGGKKKPHEARNWTTFPDSTRSGKFYS